jgi:two-component system response regulator FixJ
MQDHLISVVDDDEAGRESLAALLGAAGFSVALYGSGEEFLAAFDPTPRGCLLLDVHLPGMTGLEVGAIVNQNVPGFPLILISGRIDYVIRARAADFGALALAKPLSDDMLVAAIERAIAGGRA